MTTTKLITDSYKGTEGYMCPEILGGDDYHPMKADIFSAGVIIFIMYCRNPPFTKAVRTDPYYKLIMGNRMDLFWKWHARNKEGGMKFFDPRFMELISSMLSHNQEFRPTPDEVMSHPWMQDGDLPGNDDLMKEFNERKNLIQG